MQIVGFRAPNFPHCFIFAVFAYSVDVGAFPFLFFGGKRVFEKRSRALQINHRREIWNKRMLKSAVFLLYICVKIFSEMEVFPLRIFFFFPKILFAFWYRINIVFRVKKKNILKKIIWVVRAKISKVDCNFTPCHIFPLIHSKLAFQHFECFRFDCVIFSFTGAKLICVWIAFAGFRFSLFFFSSLIPTSENRSISSNNNNRVVFDLFGNFNYFFCGVLCLPV